MSTVVRNLPFIGRESENISGCRTAADAIKAVGLDWSVDKEPACFEFEKNGKPYLSYLENAYIIHRTDTGLALGFAKSRYKVVQNVEAFSFFDSIIHTGEATWYSAGTYDNGKNVYITARLNTTFVVGGKDPIEVFITFVNSHEGGVGIKIIVTPVRIVSGAVLQIPDKYNKFSSVIRHDNRKDDNIVNAKKLVEQIRNTINDVESVYNTLMESEITIPEMYNVIASIFFTKREYDNLKLSGYTARDVYKRNTQAIAIIDSSYHKLKQFRTFIDYYFAGINHLDYYGKAWGLYIAICGYYCNIDRPNLNDYNRMMSIISGNVHRKCLAVLEYLIK